MCCDAIIAAIACFCLLVVKPRHIDEKKEKSDYESAEMT